MSVRILSMFVVASVLIVGCSGPKDTIKTGSVTGEVKKLSGEPVGKVKVVFYPKSGPTAVATADANGKFTATVPLGECRVAIVSGGEATSTDMSPEATEKAAEGDSKVDTMFANPESSGLSCKVEEKQGEKVVFVVK